MKLRTFILIWIPSILSLSILCYIIANGLGHKGDPNLEKVQQGQMSRVTYQGHSYIVWGISYGGGCVHDPDCACLKEKK